MDKNDYITIYNDFWNDCLDKAKAELIECGVVDITEDKIYDMAAEIFEEIANSAKVVGYYIIYHGDGALKDWKSNIEGINLTEKDKEVDQILEMLYS